MVAACNISDLEQCKFGVNMALDINYNHIMYCHMDPIWAIMLAHSDFTASDLSKGGSELCLLSAIDTTLEEPNI